MAFSANSRLRQQQSARLALFALSFSPLSLSLGLPLAAQQGSGPVLHTAPAGSSTPTVSVDAKLVNIPVIVHDKHGALVQNLKQDNFVLWVDNKPAAIRYFNQDTNLPLTLGLLVDVSLSQRDVLDDERKASTAFLDDMLAASDKAFVIQFAGQAELLQDLTGSKPKLQEGLQQLSTPSPGSNRTDSSSSGDQSGDNNGSNNGSNSGNDGDNGGYGRGGHGGRGGSSDSGRAHPAGTVLYDALFLSSNEVIGKQTGRKALVILSDGVDRSSKESLVSAIEAAQRADTIVYAIYFKGHDQGGGFQDRGGHGGGGFPGGRGGGFPGGGGYPGGGGGRGGGNRQPEMSADGKKVLQRIADQTGGRLFEMDKKNSLADIYKQIGDELRAQYRLGYTPDKDAASDGYHRIQVSLKGDPKDLFTQARDGYYTGPPD